MSYDYDALVQQFIQHRHAAATSTDQPEHLTQAVQALETLSAHCPLTPLLWIQYAAAMRDCLQTMDTTTTSLNAVAAARTAQSQLLALGLQEFPGSLLLHARYVHVCLEQDADHHDHTNDTTQQALTQAIAQVGQGSHPNHPLVAWLYRRLARVQRQRNDNDDDDAYQVFVQQAQRPLGTVNDDLTHIVQSFASRNDVGDERSTETGEKQPPPPAVLASLDQAKLWVSKVYGSLASHEDDLQARLYQGQMLDLHHLSWQEETDTWDWTEIDLPKGQRFGMGLGDAALAKAFGRYAAACWQQKPHKGRLGAKEQDTNTDNDKESAQRQAIELHKQTELPWSIYERGVAECPTVESLWLSYLHDVQKRGTPTQRRTLPQLVQRAKRNCPYSVALVQLDIEIHAQLVQQGLMEELEPDVLWQRVQTAWDGQFLPGGADTWVNLMLQVVQVVRQRLLSLVFPAFDTEDKKQLTVAATTHTWDDDTRDEVEDLLADLKEMMDLLGQNLFEKFPKHVPGRAKVLQERALIEYHLTGPLERLMKQDDDVPSEETTDSALEAFEKAARIHPNPDTYLTWIHYWQHNKAPPSRPIDVVHALAQIRCTFAQAWQQVSPKATGPRDFATGLAELAHEWTEWERLFGSSQSLKRAQSAIQKRYRKMQEQEGKKNRDAKPDNRGKRHGHEKLDEPAAKKAKVQEQQVAVQGVAEPKPMDVEEEKVPTESKETKTETQDTPKTEKTPPASEVNEKTGKKKGPRVVINGLEYPAHPFTVRVSNLANDVEDMELVDLFRPKCGAIVHARIVREKGHGKTKSKGWGLVQFELAESVDKALALNGEVGLHEKLLTVDRSNAPAVMLVPPGMHRLNAKGEGRSSKRNEKKRTGAGAAPPSDETKEVKEAPQFVKATRNDQGAPTSPAAPPRPSVLSLAPRGVRKASGARPKPKITVPPASEAGTKES